MASFFPKIALIKTLARTVPPPSEGARGRPYSNDLNSGLLPVLTRCFLTLARTVPPPSEGVRGRPYSNDLNSGLLPILMRCFLTLARTVGAVSKVRLAGVAGACSLQEAA